MEQTRGRVMRFEYQQLLSEMEVGVPYNTLQLAMMYNSRWRNGDLKVNNIYGVMKSALDKKLVKKISLGQHVRNSVRYIRII